MNYDENVEEVEKFSSDEKVARLVSYLVDWKLDNTNVLDLAESVERIFGNSWISSQETHDHLYRLWSSFKAEAVLPLGGMTMNERLYCFGLMELYDDSGEEKQRMIYTKLCSTA